MERVGVQGGREWEIGTLKGTGELMAKYCVREGEGLWVPLMAREEGFAVGSDVNLWAMDKENYVENLNMLIQVDEHFIQIPGLPSGRYTLSILSLNYTGTIVVLKGK